MKESPTNRGARLELLVATDLMRQNFYCFLAASRVGKTDVVCKKRNATLSVQVKSRIGDWKRSLAKNDVLAVVSNNGTPRYFCKHRFKSKSLFESIQVLKARGK